MPNLQDDLVGCFNRSVLEALGVPEHLRVRKVVITLEVDQIPKVEYEALEWDQSKLAVLAAGFRHYVNGVTISAADKPVVTEHSDAC